MHRRVCCSVGMTMVSSDQLYYPTRLVVPLELHIACTLTGASLRSAKLINLCTFRPITSPQPAIGREDPGLGEGTHAWVKGPMLG